MATFTKTEYGWKAQIRRKGISKTVTFRTKAEAKLWATQIELEIESGVMFDWAGIFPDHG